MYVSCIPCKFLSIYYTVDVFWHWYDLRKSGSCIYNAETEDGKN